MASAISTDISEVSPPNIFACSNAASALTASWFLSAAFPKTIDNLVVKSCEACNVFANLPIDCSELVSISKRLYVVCLLIESDNSGKLAFSSVRLVNSLE